MACSAAGPWCAGTCHPTSPIIMLSPSSSACKAGCIQHPMCGRCVMCHYSTASCAQSRIRALACHRARVLADDGTWCRRGLVGAIETIMASQAQTSVGAFLEFCVRRCCADALDAEPALTAGLGLAPGPRPCEGLEAAGSEDGAESAAAFYEAAESIAALSGEGRGVLAHIWRCVLSECHAHTAWVLHLLSRGLLRAWLHALSSFAATGFHGAVAGTAPV